MSAGTLLLIPWHIGHWGDMTFNAVRQARRLRLFLAEDAADAAKQFSSVLRIDCAAKEFRTIPVRPDKKFMARALQALKTEDVGVVSSGGIPCFADPGAWIVREARAAGVPVVALGGPSSLAALLSLSGYDWINDPPSRAFSFVFFMKSEKGGGEGFRARLGRADEPVVVFVEKGAVAECLEAIRASGCGRPVSLFLDLTKGPRFPHANQVRTMSAARWASELGSIDWEKVSDAAMMIHPGASAA